MKWVRLKPIKDRLLKNNTALLGAAFFTAGMIWIGILMILYIVFSLFK